MGFPVERTLYRLRFDAEHLTGLEVEVAAMSVREAWAYNDAIAEAPDNDARFRLMVETVARQLASWNLEKAPGEPWPMTLDGLLDLDDSIVSPIILGWLQAIRPQPQAPDPTRQAASIEASLPMAPLPEPSGSEPAPAG